MTSRSSSVALLITLGTLACGAPAPDVAEAPPQDELIRTADPYARGYADADFPRIKELADGVYSYEQLRAAGDEMFTTVSLFIVTDEGVLLADGQGSVEETQRLVDHIAEITDQPITHYVVGSDHGDHTGGNSALPQGIVVYAHPNSAAILEASANAPNRRPDAPPVLLATELVPDRTTLHLGGKEIQILFLGRAHTGGDLSVYVPEDKILFMSEAYLHRVFPAMRSAYPSEWIAAIERAQAMDVDVYVPGHGFVDSPALLEEELEVYKQALMAVLAEGKRLHDAGLPLAEAQDQASFGDLQAWSLYSSQAARAIQQVYAELDGELSGSNP